MEESERQSTIIWDADNTFKRYVVEKGDVDAVWKEAAHIVEGEYFTGAQEQLYIENNGIIAAFDPKNGVTVWGSLQCPYYVHKALMALCGLPERQDSRRADGDRRRLRRKGRVSVHDRGACGTARDQVRQTG